MAPDEISVIDRFFRPLAGEGGLNLLDDAARLRIGPDDELVVTVDMIAVGMHFLPADPPDTVAKKALRVNLSDLAAKGAAPLGYLLSLGLHAGADETWLAAFSAGLRDDQQQFGIHLLGGDTIAVSSGPVISITALGTVAKGRMVHRFGGRPGDALYVSGTIGAGVAGLALIRGEAGPWDRWSDADRAKAVSRWRVPEPRVALSPAVRDWASAAMDVSDGLVGDCDKLAAASGCVAVIEAENVPIPGEPSAMEAHNSFGILLTGGDDYEILAAVPPENEASFKSGAEAAGVPVTRIGSLREGSGPTEVLLRGEALAFAQRSFVHGRSGG